MSKKRGLAIYHLTEMFPRVASGGIASHVEYLVRGMQKLHSSRRMRINVITVSGNGKSEKVSIAKKPPLIVHRLLGEKSHFLPHGAIPYEEAIKYCLSEFNNAVRENYTCKIMSMNDNIVVFPNCVIKF